MKTLILSIFITLFSFTCQAEIYKVTAYCKCYKCCGKVESDTSYGITASGKVAEYGDIACNHLKFNTLVYIDGLGTFNVQDRGSRRYFGSFKYIKKHIDIYMNSHEEAKEFGVKYLDITIGG